MTDTRKLTVMAWLAADTGRYTGDLRDAIRRDLDELREGARLAGEQIAVWAVLDEGSNKRLLMDDLTNNKTHTFVWGAESGMDYNMADPANLTAFADFVMEHSPAEQYALIIGGHGSGPKKQDVYRGIRPRLVVDYEGNQGGDRVHIDVAADGTMTAVPLDHIADTSKMADGETTCAKSAQVDLAYDDGSRQALSIADMGMVCRHIAERGPLALVLLDACHMASVEVCEAVAGSAEVLVASPEAIPAEGFPYAHLLQSWSFAIQDAAKWDNPYTRVGQLASLLGAEAVNVFSRAYESDSPDAPVASIVAVDLKGVPEQLDLMDRAAMAVMERPRPINWQRAGDRDFAYLAAMMQYVCDEPLIDSWQSLSAPPAGLTAYIPERGPLPRWYLDLPIAQRPFGQMVRRIVEGA